MSRAECTKGNPMTPERQAEEGDRWSHEGAHEVGEQEDGYPGGDIVTYRCRDCGETWRAELPQ